jgi:hypothetical protein
LNFSATSGTKAKVIDVRDFFVHKATSMLLLI